MAAANKVKVSGWLYLPWVLVESNERNDSSKFTAMIRVKAPPSVRSSSNALPVHLVVVLDVCGTSTTTGQRATGPSFDLLKTMKFIKEEFDTQDHQVDVVTATELLPIANWISAAQGNHTGGTADLKKRTLEALNKQHQPNRVGFIILLSDGESKFKYDDRGFQEVSKYPVHALGLGKKHDTEGLHGIAEASKGTYSSVPVTDTSKVMEAIALCLGGLKSVVAINTRVRIKAELDRSSDSLMKEDDIKIKIQPGDRDVSESTNQGGFPVGDGVLYAGEVKDLIVDIIFSTVQVSSRTRSATLTATVEYEDTSSAHKEGRRPVTVKCKLPLLVTGTTNKPAMRAYETLLPDSLVRQRMFIVELLEKLATFENGSLKKKKKTATGDLLRSMWDELKKKQGKDLKADQKMSVLIDHLDNDMEAMASCLEREGVSSGLSCIYSWESSYRMQRATTTGLPLPPPFLTPAVEEAARNVISRHLMASSRRQRAIMLLEELEKLFDDDYPHNNLTAVHEALKFGSKVHEVVKAAINGGGGTRTRTTAAASASGSGDKEMPAAAAAAGDLNDKLKSTTAIWLFDYYCANISGQDDMLKIYEAAKEAINCWRRVQGRSSLPAAAAAAAAAASGEVAPPAHHQAPPCQYL